MRDIPVMLGGYKLMVVEAPAPKTYTDDDGVEKVSVDRDGATLFVVSLFARLRSMPGMRTPKGEEIKVTLETDPGPNFGEDTVVELVDPRVTYFEIKAEGKKRAASGLSFRARGLTPAGRPTPVPAPAARGGEDK